MRPRRNPARAVTRARGRASPFGRTRRESGATSGYGKLRETTFRIGHMGDQNLHTLNGLLTVLDDCLVN